MSLHFPPHLLLGSGMTAIFNEELFNKRALVLTRYVQSPSPSKELPSDDDPQLEVLNALQLAVAKLEHPPSEQD